MYLGHDLFYQEPFQPEPRLTREDFASRAGSSKRLSTRLFLPQPLQRVAWHLLKSWSFHEQCTSYSG